jgi:succinoglycan biosynthesis protein ExoM
MEWDVRNVEQVMSDPSHSPVVEERSVRRVRVAVGICTFHRNRELQRLLDTVITAAAAAELVAEVGVVVVDDSKEAMARSVVAGYENRFALGIHYVNTASANISTARNAVLEGGIAFADWIAMIDDDGVVSEGWIREYVIAQQRYDAEILSGPIDFVPDGPAPKWLDQEILGWTDQAKPDGGAMETAFTANAFISGHRLRANPEWRFAPAYGELGGEDMIFFRSAFRDGAKMVYAAKAQSTEVMNPQRIRFSSQLRAHLYVGNSDTLVHLHLKKATRARMALRGARSTLRSVTGEVRHATKHRKFRPAVMLWHMSFGVGQMSGALGFKIKHKGY